MSLEDRVSEQRRLRERREALRLKAKRKSQIDTAAKVVVYAAVTVAFLALVAALYALSGLFFSAVVWNLGVVGLVGAVGGSVSKIGFWTGVAAVFVIGVVTRLLHGPTKVEQSKDA